jgi:formylglycine-generating enzyme required for sulfatase activity
MPFLQLLKRGLCVSAYLILFCTSSHAGSLCSPKSNNARILSAPSPNAIDPQWAGDSFIGIGWSFYLHQTIKGPTGIFGKGNLHGTRGGIAQKDVFILLSEWTCQRSGPEEIGGIDDEDLSRPANENAEAAASTQSAGTRMTENDSASHPALSTFKDCDRCPEMVVLPTGSFLMGAGPDDFRVAGGASLNDELPRHSVTISYPLAFSKFELTVDEFATYVEETGTQTGGACELRIPETGPGAGRFIGTVKQGAERYPGLVTIVDGDFRRPGANVSGRQPATCISRREAEAYLEWLSQKTGRHYRLPSESEWEYAARSGSTSAFYFGSSRRALCTFGNFADRASPYNASFVAQCAERPSPMSTAVVGSYRPNAWGLYDMAGNVFEFTADCSANDYRNAPNDGSAYMIPGCRRFVQRSYTLESMDTLLRSASRCAEGDEDSRSNILGLRVAVNLSEGAPIRSESEPETSADSSLALNVEADDDKSAVAAAAAENDPAIFIRAIYKTFELPTATPASVDLVFSKNLKSKDKDIDLTGFIGGGQDYRLSSVEVSLLSQSGEEALVRATFKNFDAPHDIRFVVKREDGHWVVDEIR